GNGKLGAMVFGNVGKETIQLNEHTVWSGSPNRNDNPDALNALPEIRKLIFEGKQKEAEILAGKTIQTQKSNGQMFQPVGSLHLTFNEHDNYTDYYRELNIENAVTKTSYIVDGVTYKREMLSSFSDDVVIVHLTASKPQSISFTASFSTPQPNSQIKTINENELVISGTTIDHEGVKGKVRFKGIARMKLDGGTVSSNDTTLDVNNANTVTIYISIATNFNNYKDISGDENKRATNYLKKAYKRSYEDALKRHIADYQKYFNRVTLDLGITDEVNLPTNVRL